MHFFSASQVDAYDGCKRKWALRYIAGLVTPQAPSARLGTEVDDEQLQPYLRDGRPFDFSRESGSGYIAESMRPHLPAPGTVRVQEYFAIPSPTFIEGRHVGFGFQGYMDLYSDDASVWPEATALGYSGIPGIGDTKTTKDFRWAKSEEALRKDTQANLYAVAIMFRTGARTVYLNWTYGRTTGARKAKRVHLVVHSDDVAEQFVRINNTALEMWHVHQQAPADGREEYALALPPTPEHCTAYGGCPYRDKCNLSPDQIADSYAAKSLLATRYEAQKEGEVIMGFVDTIRALKEKKQGTAAAPALAPTPAQAEPPAVPDVPEQLPAWALEKEPYRGKQGETVPPPAWALDPKGLPGGPINPPESALPPAPPVGTVAPVAAPPAAETKAKRGRPKKEPGPIVDVTDRVVYDPDQPIPYVPTSGITPTPISFEQTVSVKWGLERVNVGNYQYVEIGPFEATVTARSGETIAEACARGYAELAAFAEGVRAAKVASFAASIKGAA